MDRVLVVGCSFLDIGAQEPLPPWDKINYKKYNIIGQTAAGNVAIAARVRHELSKQHYDHVVIVWSGINRVDIEKAKHQYDEMPQGYPHVIDLGDMFWFLSGGMCGTWHENCPEPVKSQFNNAFRDLTSLRATDITMEAVVNTQRFLTERNISYTMSFIYDIHQDYNSVIDIFGNRSPRKTFLDRWPNWLALEHCLGQVDTASTWYDQVDWTKFPAKENPYEYCVERNLLRSDNFHPTKEGLKQWFSHQMDIYLTDS
jgi:hypothetical protein